MTLIRRKFNQIKSLLEYPKYEPVTKSLCKFLKSSEEVELCTRYLYQRGYEPHVIKFKNWDLANIIPEIHDGNFLDMGSSDSFILKNLKLTGINGELFGIDLREPISPVRGVHYAIGDMLQTNYPDNFFKNISCLSVIEHEVDFNRFAKEASRLLMNGGRLFVTFDYWNPKVTSNIKLYDLSWQPLDRNSVINLINECSQYQLYPVQEMDWTLGDPIVNKENYSPDPSVSYTFGLITFQKKL
jgi:SAM-dependent methyltransferase